MKISNATVTMIPNFLTIIWPIVFLGQFVICAIYLFAIFMDLDLEIWSIVREFEK